MKLEDRVSELESQLTTLLERVTVLENGKARGPKADRPMTDADAYRIRFGDLKGLNHKDAAAQLGLSYGQVFSCRGGYTFKHVKDKTRNDDGSEIPKEPKP